MWPRKPVEINLYQEQAGPVRDITIHEHHAPTTESVRLLRDMEAAAGANVRSIIPLNNNTLQAIMVVERSCIDMLDYTNILLQINGKKIEVKYQKGINSDLNEFVTGLRKAVADKLTDEILTTLITNNGDQWQQILRKY